MKIDRVEVVNFRILENFAVDLEENLSVVIGKNNVGKTSFLAILDKFLAPDKPEFLFEDFSIAAQQAICALEDTQQLVEEYIETPLSLKLYISYTDNDDISIASEFLLDLDVNVKYFVLLEEFVLTFEKYQQLVSDYTEYKQSVSGRDFRDYIAHNVNHYFSIRLRALEYGNEVNSKVISAETISRVISMQTIVARRDVDNEQGKKKSLSVMANKYYKNIGSDLAFPNLQQQLVDTDKKLTDEYKVIFADIVHEIKEMSYSPNEAEIAILSTLIDRPIFQDNTVVKYRHDNTLLPEDYNGLGYLNLFAIMFDLRIKLDRLAKKNCHDERPTPVNLLFIEEPEAHTHPQMQYVFIMNIKHILQKRRMETAGFNFQTVITTHSAHIVSQCDFQDIKYFYRRNDALSNVQSRSLRFLYDAMVSTKVTAKEGNEKREQEERKSAEETAFRFVKQYITLHRAEMFFADKAILIEGDTERMLVAAMMRKFDDANRNDPAYIPLLSQNISIIEVGAYAKVFSTFLGFIGIKTAIFTDLDCAKKNDSNRYSRCPFIDATVTTNATIKYFLGTDSITEIAAKTADERTFEYNPVTKRWNQNIDGHLRLCYQCKDNNYQPTSFEDTFICQNLQFIVSQKADFQGLKCIEEMVEDATNYYGLADRCIKSKTTFALDILMNGGKDNELWSTPKYIVEGMEWLSI